MTDEGDALPWSRVQKSQDLCVIITDICITSHLDLQEVRLRWIHVNTVYLVRLLECKIKCIACS